MEEKSYWFITVMEKIEKSGISLKIIKGVIISIVFTVIALTVFAVLLRYTNLSERLIQPVVITVTGISILLGSFFATRKMKKNGMNIGFQISYFLQLQIPTNHLLQ